MGRRIPSGPGGQHSKFIRTDISPRPLDPTLQQQQQSKLDNETYDSVDDDNDYLAPVQTLPRLSSMEGRPLPSPSESSMFSFHMLTLHTFKTSICLCSTVKFDPSSVITKNRAYLGVVLHFLLFSATFSPSVAVEW